MIQGGKVLTKDYYGYKVIQLSDGRMAKLFRLKSYLSSALVWPYAKRFVRGADVLKKNGIPTVHVIDLCRIPSIKRDMVLYHPLEGISLREALQNESDKTALIEHFASFLADLHAKGIYFRAIHFNNVIVTPEGRLGLIDISDLHYSFFPLTVSKRVRNFKPILHYPEDRQILEEFSINEFLKQYIDSAGWSSIIKGEKMVRNVLASYF